MTQTCLNLQLEPGQKITLYPVSWPRFESVLLELGEKRNSRIAYAQECLEIMTPLPEHERSKVLLADLIKALLNAEKRPWESLGSTTLKRQMMAAGVEPDDCFYIENYQAVIGKNRLDLSLIPPPDLAIEIDLTSKTEISAYQALSVPELWIYSQDKLTIYVLNNGEYHQSLISSNFPRFNVIKIVPELMKRSKIVGVSQTLLEFAEMITDKS